MPDLCAHCLHPLSLHRTGLQPGHTDEWRRTCTGCSGCIAALPWIEPSSAYGSSILAAGILDKKPPAAAGQ